MDKDLKYEDAIRELQSLTSRLEQGNMDVDSLGEQLKRAKFLIQYCKDKLTKTDEEIKKILETSK
ncbi:exodeoxyribonuclease VII small subunit [Segatella albensis]|jgi:exodeoxyribonuclease VII small subunit|uniref:exodeoxyribonuclease VII small subunit n=1 Tax=Segatella albensis TaxID=77768 RepID=UPI00041331E4|nr:exodeoxyribonuclease VII small subunit [Segatella albensis]